ncbi:MAG TPA: acetoacetate--CoA ligase, partial [Polyangiaceae bacterium]|nr:acetoacetate--CoA ligase [Polyangiaceae bacterium]
ARVRSALQKLGITQGDRVAGFVPNTPETVCVFLAVASLGAIWSSCAPEFGVASVLDRFRQIEPKVLFGCDGYLYGGKRHDRREALAEIAGGLPTVKATVCLPSEGGASLTTAGIIPWERFLGPSERDGAGVDGPRANLAMDFVPVPFDHPLWILYSSGTTGLPKPIVQGHGGILLEHWKALALHCDVGDKDRFFWFTTTGWMMWNFLVGGLLRGATILLYDGSPAHPDLSALWRFAEESKMTVFGTSAPYLLACRKAGIAPSRFDLSALRHVGSTGAPLPAEGFEWVYANVKADLQLGSMSGGTDVCTAFVLANPWLPVYSGEIQCRGLGCKVEAFDAGGNSVMGEVGELVLSEPMPSMPLFFWGDTSGGRMREAYFESWPGVWRHGDWIRITRGGGCVIYGRSDSTLNRGGVRMGTSELYRVVEALPEVADSLVVDTGALGHEDKLWLFVVAAAGAAPAEALERKLKATLREKVSPRHVPDKIVFVPEIPRTINGKKMEVPVKKLLMGTPLDQALNLDTMANPKSIEPFLALANVRD